MAAAVLTAAGIAAVTSLQSNLSERTVLTSTVTQHEVYTERVARDIDKRLRLARASLSELSGNLNSSHLADPSALHYYLASRIGLQREFESIAVFGLDGQLLASRPSAERGSVAQHSWFETSLREARPLVRAPVRCFITGEQVVALSYPIHDEQGRLRGVLSGAIALDQTQLMAAVSGGLNDHARFMLFSDDHTIITHPVQDYIGQPLQALGDGAETILAGLQAKERSRIGTDHRGHRGLFAFQTIPAANWTLVGVVADEQARAALSRLSGQMLAAGAVLAVLLFLAMWLLVSRMLRPLDQLRDDMRRLRDSGTASTARELPRGISTELRRVMTEFGNMAAAWRTAEAALQQEKERAEVTLASIADGVIATDRAGRIVALNRAAETITGWNEADALGRPFADVFRIQDERTGTPLPDVARAAINNGAVTNAADAVLQARDGSLVPIDHSAAPIHTPERQIDGAVVVFSNVAAERAAAQQLEWRATHDAMTGLLNRSAFDQAIETLFDSPAPRPVHALLMLDLDEFKAVNDSCGHAAGDELLKQLAQLLRAKINDDDLLARIGGDEFAVLMYGSNSERAMQLAETLRQVVYEFSFEWGRRVFRVGCSIGVVEINECFTDVAAVQRAGDMACYMAKRGGRNRICLHTDDHVATATVRSEMNALGAIRDAIEEGRLRVYAQRINRLDDTANTGDYFEALLRLVDADGRHVAPGSFLPAAERYGAMLEIDRWMIGQVVRLCADHYGPDHWHELDTVSINLSATTLRDPGLHQYIIDQLRQHGMPFDRVCLEITETAAMANLEQVTGLMHALRAKGLRFALDDFGVGVTSLSQLRDLPIDVLKIDGSFIDEVHLDEVNGLVVEAIQLIARRLSMRTVAERIERPEELVYLRRLGVTYGQGFLLARPQLLEEFVRARDAAVAQI